MNTDPPKFSPNYKLMKYRILGGDNGVFIGFTYK